MFIIKYCATDAGVITRVRVFFRRVHDYARECVRTRGGFRVGGLGLGLDPSRYARYPNEEEEDAHVGAEDSSSPGGGNGKGVLRYDTGEYQHAKKQLKKAVLECYR